MDAVKNGGFCGKADKIYMKSVFKQLKKYLQHPAALGMDMDAPESNQIFFQIISDKPFLKQIYTQWYLDLANSLPENVTGPVLELGSGAGFMKKYIPDLITSEILDISNVDIVLDGQSLPFSDASLRAIVMLDVLHHLPKVKFFLKEAARCIKPGGVVAMIEPWYTKWSGFIYSHLHSEPFFPDADNWHFPVGGPLSAANGALPWIVFNRDRAIFQNEFPDWQILKIRLHTPFVYLLSGGLSMRSFVPGNSFGLCRKIENTLIPWMDSFAMFATIIIKKKRQV